MRKILGWISIAIALLILTVGFPLSLGGLEYLLEFWSIFGILIAVVVFFILGRNLI